MDSITDLVKAITLTNYDVGSSHWVDVSHINNPHSFYVRPTQYRRYLADLHSYGDPLVASELQLHQNVVYKSKLTRTFVRGKIIFIQTDRRVTCDIYAVDYGCFEKSVPLKWIHKPIQTGNIPPLAIHCQLAHCQPRLGTWTSEVTDTMKQFIGRERALMVIEEKKVDALIIELHNSCPENIALMLAYCGCATLGYSRSSVGGFSSSSIPQHYFTYKTPAVGDELCVRLQIGKTLKSFFVATVTDYKFYLKQRELVDSLSQKQIQRVEDVKKGVPVAVYNINSHHYERAIIKHVALAESKATVQLVDWGQTLEVPFNELKPLSKHLFTYPALAIYCRAEEKQEQDYNLQKILHPGYEFNIVVIATGSGFDSQFTVKISLKHSKK